MARKKLIVDQIKLNWLREMAERKFSQSVITSRDCEAFTRELKKTTGELLSSQTIRRFFGLIEPENTPSVFTLNVISKYAAQKDWNQFCKEEVLSNPISAHDVKGIIDFYTAYQFNNDKVIDKVIAHEILRNTVLSVLANSPIGARYFFEERPLRDYLCGEYTDALKIYLKTKNYGSEACLFTYGLLFIGAFLSENEQDIKGYYLKIKDIEITDEIYNIPAARKYGVALMYHHLHQAEWEFEQVFNAAIAIRFKYTLKMEYCLNNFDLILIEHLLIVERYKECQIVLDLHLADKLKVTGGDPISPDFYGQIYNLAKGIIYYHNHRKKEGISILKTFDMNLLRIGEKIYYNLPYLLFLWNTTSLTAVKKRANLINQINELIEKTGYSWYKNHLNSMIG